jgi:hypothetical protein
MAEEKTTQKRRKPLFCNDLRRSWSHKDSMSLAAMSANRR